MGSSWDFFPLIFIWNLPPCNLLPLPPILSLCALKKTLALSLSDQLVVGSSTVCLSASLPQAEEIQLSQSLLIWPVLHVLYQLCGLCWTHSSISIPILYFRVQKRTVLDVVLKSWSNMDHFPCATGDPFPNAAPCRKHVLPVLASFLSTKEPHIPFSRAASKMVEPQPVVLDGAIPSNLQYLALTELPDVPCNP